MTHAELVEIAARWLRNVRKCRVVLTEPSSYVGEVPDAIGWRGVECTVIECKTSLADLRREGKKYLRRPHGDGIGTFRYYLVPTTFPRQSASMWHGWGLLDASEIGRNGWGLLVASETGRVKVQVPPCSRASDARGETMVLLSELALWQRMGRGCDVILTGRARRIGREAEIVVETVRRADQKGRTT